MAGQGIVWETKGFHVVAQHVEQQLLPDQSWQALCALDDATDFARHDLIAAARTGGLAGGSIPVWIDVGTQDPFRSAE